MIKKPVDPFLDFYYTPDMIFNSQMFGGGAVIDSSLLAWWKLNENTGTATADASPNGNTGTLAAGVTWIAGPAGSSGVSFSGAAQNVIASSSAAYSGTGLTVSVWFNPSVLTRGDLVTRWLGGTAGSQFTLLYGLTSGIPQFYVTTGAALANSGAGATAMVNGTWYHIVGTYDGASIKVYLDGVLQSSTAFAGALNTASLTSYRLGDNGGGDGQTSGKIDDARVYGRALSGAEISALHAAGAL